MSCLATSTIATVVGSRRFLSIIGLAREADRLLHFFCFFFQAEDGIRDLTVTGVQTCALPISLPKLQRHFLHAARLGFAQPRTGAWTEVLSALPQELSDFLHQLSVAAGQPQSRIDAALRAYL